MKSCPCCHGSTRITKTETVNNAVRRRRVCASCGRRYNTVELIVQTPNKGGPTYVEHPPFARSGQYIGMIYGMRGK